MKLKNKTPTHLQKKKKRTWKEYFKRKILVHKYWSIPYNFVCSSILSFWITLALSTEHKYHILGNTGTSKIYQQYRYISIFETKNVRFAAVLPVSAAVAASASRFRLFALCFSSSLNFSALASSHLPSSIILWSGRFLLSVGATVSSGSFRVMASSDRLYISSAPGLQMGVKR